jgi:hypothetical protein
MLRRKHRTKKNPSQKKAAAAASRSMPSPQMLQTLLPAGKRGQIPTSGARTLEMVEFEAVFSPVGEADEVLGAVSGFLEPVAFQLGFGGEVGEAVAALGGGKVF